MSLEDQYDAWVRGLMGGGKYAATPKQAEGRQRRRAADAGPAGRPDRGPRRQTAAGSALNAVQKAGAATAGACAG